MRRGSGGGGGNRWPGRRRGGGGGRSGRGAGTATVVDTMAPLEMFRRFLVRAARGNVAEAYRRRRDVFPCSYGTGGADGGGGAVKSGGGGRERIMVDADGDSQYVVDAIGRPVVRSGVGLLRVPPGGRVRKIDYRSSSGRTSLTWRWDPDNAYRRLGRVNGVVTNWSLEYLGVAGVVTPEWAAGQGPIMRAKRARAEAAWPATPDLRTMGFNRRDRRIAERRDLDSGARLRFPTGYEDDGKKRRNGAEHDGTGIPGMPPGAQGIPYVPAEGGRAAAGAGHARAEGTNS